MNEKSEQENDYTTKYTWVQSPNYYVRSQSTVLDILGGGEKTNPVKGLLVERLSCLWQRVPPFEEYVVCIRKRSNRPDSHCL